MALPEHFIADDLKVGWKVWAEWNSFSILEIATVRESVSPCIFAKIYSLNFSSSLVMVSWTDLWIFFVLNSSPHVSVSLSLDLFLFLFSQLIF